MRPHARLQVLVWLGLAMVLVACSATPTGTVVIATSTPPTTVAEPSALSTPTLPPATRRPVSTALAPTATPAVRVLPDEPWIVYEASVPGDYGVGNVVIRPDGSDEHWATPDAPISNTGPQGGDGWQLHPDWSPDGSQLAFAIDSWPDTNGHRDIWISDADGSNSRRLYDCVRPCDMAEYPAWSKDGKSVMFVRTDFANDVSEGSQLLSVDVESGEVSVLATTTGADYFAYPRYSPDGSRVVAQIDTWTSTGVESTLESTAIAVVDLSTKPATVTKLTEPDQWATYPDWHPTDDLIVFTAGPGSVNDSGLSGLFTMRPDGSHQRTLFEGWQRTLHPTWLPDGSGVILILLTAPGIGSATMNTIRADGTGLGFATSDGPHFGTHPRLRPLP